MLSGVSFITILGHVSVKMAVIKTFWGKGCPGDDFIEGRVFFMVRMEVLGKYFCPLEGIFNNFG